MFKKIYSYLKSIFTKEQMSFEEWNALVDSNVSEKHIPFIAEYWSKRLVNEIMKEM